MSRYPSDKPTRVVAVDDAGAVWLEASSPDAWQHAAFTRGTPDMPPSWDEQRQVLSRLAPAGAEIMVWVLGHASMPCWLQAPPQGTRSLKELQAIVCSRARQWLNPAHRSDQFLVHADWNASHPFFCEALPTDWQALLGPTPRVSSPMRLALEHLSRRRLPPGWHAITTPDEAHLLLRQDGRWQQLRSLRLRGGATAAIADQVRNEWQRERLRQAGPEGHLQWTHLGHTDEGWRGSDVQWLDADWQQLLNQLPNRPDVPDVLTKAGHQLWVYQTLGIGSAAP